MKSCLLLILFACIAFPQPTVSRETSFVPPPVTYLHGVRLSQAQVALKQAVATAFVSEPVMVQIAGCESSYRQFDAHGKPLISKTDDVGVMQINLPTWKGKAKLLGLDIASSSEDNIKMAEYILQEQGIKAWSCAKQSYNED